MSDQKLAVRMHPDGRCDCDQGSKCPLGKTGASARCTAAELSAAGYPLSWPGPFHERMFAPLELSAETKAKLEELRGQVQTMRAVISNDSENEDKARRLAAQVLPEKLVYGDSFGVPTIDEIVKRLVSIIRKNDMPMSDGVLRLLSAAQLALDWVRTRPPNDHSALVELKLSEALGERKQL
jgi:hypothetical protein